MRMTASPSVSQLRAVVRIESVRKWFDPQYCRDKARWVLDKFNGDFELLDWAAHLTELALVVQPGSHAARLLKARAQRLRGELMNPLPRQAERRGRGRAARVVDAADRAGLRLAHGALFECEGSGR